MTHGISYVDKTYNPIAMRCDPVGEECAHCWHLAMAKRHAANPNLPKALREARGGGPFALLEDVLREPLSRKKPTRYAVQFMGDLYHAKVPFEWVDRVFAVMALCPQHTFLICTKRPERMAEYLAPKNDRHNMSVSQRIYRQVIEIADKLPVRQVADIERVAGQLRWPIPGVWLGTSVGNQAAKKRIDDLRRCPAAVRWISAEPLLEDLGKLDLTGISWVVIGGESGPKARPCNVDWIRSIVRQCEEAGVKCFVKQDSGHKTGTQGRIPDDIWVFKELHDARP